jgi:hypothetical protein
MGGPMAKRILSLVAVTLTIVISCASAAQADTPTPPFAVTPTQVVAGSSVQLSGQCDADEKPFVYGYYVNDSSSSFSGSLDPGSAHDGSFSTPFPIPRESAGGTWQFRLSCTRSDLGRPSDRVNVTVSADDPKPLAADLTPPNPSAGGTLDVAGTGCAVNGRGLDEVIISISLLIGNTAPEVKTTVRPDGSGAFGATLQLPENYPAGPTFALFDCRETGAPDGTPGWSRWSSMPITVIEGSVPPSTKPSTTVPATVVVQGVQSVLPRTGLPAPLMPGALLLVVAGLGLLTATASRR